MRRKYNLQDEIDKLYEELQLIEGLVGSPGGIRLREMVDIWVREYEETLVPLAIKQAKLGIWQRLFGDNELLYKHAVHTVCCRLQLALKTTVTQRERIMSEIRDKETIQEAALEGQPVYAGPT